MAELGPEEGRALCEALEGPAPTSVRLHPQRPCRWSGAEAVPWSPAGRYLTERPSFTLDPAFHAGAYYVQEASSQFLAHVLAGEEVAGKRILDLCAAPGGKTTLYASLAGSDGLVVANEVNRQRAAVLADNVRKWGLGNVAVTVNEPAQIAVLEGWFDIVAVDAPCSGEGMFRKIPEARDEWSENNVKICAVRQAEILREAWKTLRPGGLLIYSTCTFNRLENEGSLEGLLAEAGEEIVESTAFDCRRRGVWFAVGSVLSGRSVSIRTGPGARDFLRRWPVRCPMAEAVSVCPSPAERFSRPPDAGSVRNCPVGSPNPSGCALRRWRMSIMRITNRSTRR